MSGNIPDWWNESLNGAISEQIDGFADWLREKISKNPPHRLIEKNPFLYRARVPESVEELAGLLLDAFVSSSEETKFGELLELIAIEICKVAKGGWESGIEGIDLEYNEGSVRHIIQIKSGIKWGNSSQKKKMKQNFATAIRVIKKGKSNKSVQPVEGICYGVSQTNEYGTHKRVVGEDFWESISGFRGSGKLVMDIIGAHSENGMSEAREKALENVVDYFKRVGVSDSNGNIQWNQFYSLNMTPVKDRPK